MSSIEEKGKLCTTNRLVMGFIHLDFEYLGGSNIGLESNVTPFAMTHWASLPLGVGALA